MTNGKRLVEVGMGLGAEPFDIFINTPLDCKKTPFSSIKIHHILDGVG